MIYILRVMSPLCLKSYVSSRLCWCYGSEDFMGVMRVLAESCSRGASGVAVSNKMLEKYIIALHLLFTDPAAWFWRRAQ